MKKILFVAMFAVVSAQACPDLSGTYSVCRSQANVLIESTDMKVSQVTNGSVTTYVFDTLPDGTSEREATPYVASGKTIKKTWTSSTGDRFESTTTARCIDNSLVVHANTTSNGENWFTESSMIRKVGNTVVKKAAGHAGTFAFVDTLTCF